jgi:pyruvate,orthophosphate dikinase
MEKDICFFGAGRADGSAQMKDLLGGKGANLAEMTNLGIPVPPGFTVSTRVCIEYLENPSVLQSLEPQIRENLARVEKLMNRKFGNKKKPLLVSVRSGAKFSMPGMMDTILNLGLNDESTEGLASQTGNEAFALDCYRRLVEKFGEIVHGVPHESFDEILTEAKRIRLAEHDYQLEAGDWKKVLERYKALYRERTREDFPQDVFAQLRQAVEAVFRSWNNPRALTYRRLHGIPHDLGTAVTVQAMVFGNVGMDSATGVAFTRDPSTGENRFYGEFLPNAQGEDVVAGIRTPYPLARAPEGGEESLEAKLPEVYKELCGIRERLEKHYRDMLDIEFTVESKKLFMLQTRVGKRTGTAALRAAVEMVDEGLISREEAVLRVEPAHLEQILGSVFDPAAKKKALAEKKFLAKGLAASPGAASGRIALSAEEAVEMAQGGDGRVVLVRIETSPEDVAGMSAAKEVRVSGRTFKRGDYLSLDGSAGEVLAGELATSPSEVVRVLVEKSLAPGEAPLYRLYERFSAWVDEVRDMKVRANADTPEDAASARAFGAEGIGLCRTEHMFFEEERIPAVREMILARTKEERLRALEKLLPFQRDDFTGILRAMAGLPVTIRLLDPPLHEFLPHDKAALEALGRRMNLPTEEVRAKVESLREANPMLGHRGCRLAITYPEIYEMQARAILEAAASLKKQGVDARPEIMLPLIANRNEFSFLRSRVEAVAATVSKEAEKYPIGTMMEVPRACLIAGAIAQEADFFSFGTNDLTQMTYGFSRDDTGSFLPEYVAKEIVGADPFSQLDAEGVGELVRMGVEGGRAVKAALKIGICGEHGGDPSSIRFCYRTGLDYVSCSPYRVPIARLAAAQAALERKGTVKESDTR